MVKSSHFEFSTVSYATLFLFEMAKFVLQRSYKVVASICMGAVSAKIAFMDSSDHLQHYFLNLFYVICSIFLVKQNMSLTCYFCTRILSTGNSNILISAKVSLILLRKLTWKIDTSISSLRESLLTFTDNIYHIYQSNIYIYIYIYVYINEQVFR